VLEDKMIYQGDCIDILPTLDSNSIHCCVTSPPYWGLRDYGVEGQLGLEKTPEEYVEKMVAVFGEVKRVLRDDGTLWLNLGDSYATHGGCKGSKHSHNFRSAETAEREGIYRAKPFGKQIGLKEKDLIGIPWRVAFALQADGWYLRQDIIWNKPNPMPESVRDRPTKAHEYIFLLSKQARYYYDADAVREPNSETSHTGGQYRNEWKYTAIGHGSSTSQMRVGVPIPRNGRNRRSVWTITTKPYKEAHFATFPEEIPRTCILAGSKKGDTILDPFSGAGTTGVVAEKLDRKYIGIELNPQYIKLAEDRIYNVQPLFAGLEL